MEENKSICWTCKNAVCGCSWSRELKLVEGAKYDYKKTNCGEFYIMRECPLYEKGHPESKRRP